MKKYSNELTEVITRGASREGVSPTRYFITNFYEFLGECLTNFVYKFLFVSCVVITIIGIIMLTDFQLLQPIRDILSTAFSNFAIAVMSK